MALIKCPSCGKDVSDQADKCIHCNCSLNLTETDDKQEEVICFFEKYAQTTKVLYFIIAAIVFIGSIFMAGETEGLSIFVGIFAALIIIGTGIFMEKNILWKAYMLKNTYEIKNKR